MIAEITLTSRAADRIRDIVGTDPGKQYLRVTVAGGGCSGFQYVFALDNNRSDDDVAIEQNGATMVIDPLSLDLYEGGGGGFRRRPHRRLVQGQESASHRLVRVRNQLYHLALARRRCRGKLCGMLVATWNINGIKARIDNAVQWLKTAAPDVCCLQEIKAEDASFPRGIIEELGYNVAVHGQKGFNGVAILSKRPFSDVRARLPGDPSDEQARYLEAVIPTENGIVRVAAIYLPNGNPPETDKYQTKLRWMDRLTMHTRELLILEEPLVLAGDYNVIPAPKDARYPANWTNDALFLPQTREKYGALLSLGLVDAVRAASVNSGIFTFWDYQAGAWQKDNGIRIDHILLSPQAADRLRAVRIDKHLRAWERPSDHVPVVADLQL